MLVEDAGIYINETGPRLPAGYARPPKQLSNYSAYLENSGLTGGGYGGAPNPDNTLDIRAGTQIPPILLGLPTIQSQSS